MRWLLRGLFACLAALALAAQVVAIPSARAGRLAVEEPTAEVLAAGLAALNLRPAEPVPSGAVFVTAEGCAGTVTVLRVGFDGLGRDAARAVLDASLTALPGASTAGRARFVYLGFVGGHAGTVAMLARWAAASALHVVGLRRPPAPREMVLVAWPPDCPELAGQDWSRLSPWN